MPIAAINHIELDGRGVARVAGTRSKVWMIVVDIFRRGYTPQQEVEHFPHLSLAQVHAALSYYFDHKDEIDRQIQRVDEQFEKGRAAAAESPLMKRVRETRETRGRP